MVMDRVGTLNEEGRSLRRGRDGHSDLLTEVETERISLGWVGVCTSSRYINFEKRSPT